MKSTATCAFGIALCISLIGCSQTKKPVKPNEDSKTDSTNSSVSLEAAQPNSSESALDDSEKPTSQEFSLLDYVKWPDEEDGTYRTFVHYKDEMEARLYLMQETNTIEDTVSQMTYTWLRGDSIPMNRSIERYSKNNWIEFVGQAFFEPAPNGEIREIKAHLDGNLKWAYDDPDLSITVFYAFYNDPNATMDFISNMRYSMVRINELDSVNDCLQLSSDELAKMYFKDDRENTVQSSFSRLTYVKGKGLVRIFQSNDDSEIEYNITE